MSLKDYSTEELLDEIDRRIGKRTVDGFQMQRRLGVSRLVLNKLAQDEGLPHFAGKWIGTRFDPDEVREWLLANRPDLLDKRTL